MDKISSLAFEECSVFSFRSYDMFLLGMLRKWISIQHAVHSPLGRRRRWAYAQCRRPGKEKEEEDEEAEGKLTAGVAKVGYKDKC